MASFATRLTAALAHGSDQGTVRSSISTAISTAQSTLETNLTAAGASAAGLEDVNNTLIELAEQMADAITDLNI